MNSRIDPARFLRVTLMADAVVCAAAGAVLLAMPGRAAASIGLGSSALMAVMGGTLIAYGLALARGARRPAIGPRDAIIPLALDVAWLIGTAVVLAGGWLNAYGDRVLVLAADVVLAFTVLEAVGLHRLTRTTAPHGSGAPA